MPRALKLVALFPAFPSPATIEASSRSTPARSLHEYLGRGEALSYS